VHEKEWQERVDPFKSYLSFAKEPCKRDREYRALLAEHRALLVEGTRQEKKRRVGADKRDLHFCKRLMKALRNKELPHERRKKEKQRPEAALSSHAAVTSRLLKSSLLLVSKRAQRVRKRALYFCKH